MTKKVKTLFLAATTLVSTSAYSEAVKIDDVYVNARKTAENIQDVPMPISSFSETNLKDTKSESVRDITAQVPNVQIIGSSSGRYITPYIRGLGNQDIQLPDESSVMMYLDEVPLPRYAFDLDFLDLKSVEVLRGPQGTFFGNSTQGGAIHFLTHAPLEKNDDKVSVAYGNDNAIKVQAQATAKVSSNIGNTLSVQYKKQDGWIHNSTLNKDYGDFENYSVQNTFQIKPTDRSNLVFKVFSQKEEGNDPSFIKAGLSKPEVKQAIDPAYTDKNTLSSLKYEHNFDSLKFISISAFNYHNFRVKYDEAGALLLSDFRATLPAMYHTAFDAYVNDPNRGFRDFEEYERQYFQEFRISSDKGDMPFTLGLNYTNKNYRLLSFVKTIHSTTLTDKTIDQNVKLTNDSVAVFGHVEKKINEKNILSAGLRVGHDIKKYDSIHKGTGTGALASYTQSSKEDYTDYSAKATYQYFLEKNHQIYSSISRSTMPGGYPSYQFNNYTDKSSDQPAYDKSVSYNYEIGTKGEFLEKHLLVNTSFFYNNITDKQVRIRDGGTGLSKFENIDVDIYGLEFESRYKFDLGLIVGANVGYTNAQYSETYSASSSETVSEGNRLSNVPYWNGNAFTQYTKETSLLGNSIFVARVDYAYTGGRYGDVTNVTKLGAIGLWNARVAIEKDNFEFALYGKNIFDKKYDDQGYYYSSIKTTVATPGDPRRYGAELSYYY